MLLRCELTGSATSQNYFHNGTVAAPSRMWNATSAAASPYVHREKSQSENAIIISSIHKNGIYAESPHRLLRSTISVFEVEIKLLLHVSTTVNVDEEAKERYIESNVKHIRLTFYEVHSVHSFLDFGVIINTFSWQVISSYHMISAISPFKLRKNGSRWSNTSTLLTW